MIQTELSLGEAGKYLLEGTRKVVVKVDVRDVDDAITKFLKSKGYGDKNFVKYGYECIAVNEWSNYQSHTFNVEPEMPDDEDKNDPKNLGTGEILNWMCAEGRVEAGEYLIDIFW
jgi:hypothetical protein